jgi:DNA-binding transcriptional LysR family regulator
VPLEVSMTSEREQVEVLRDERADVSFVRLPVQREGLNVIPLYSETAVVVVPKEHPIAAVDTVTLADLERETRQDPGPHGDPDALRGAVELVAAGVGVLVLPQSVARLHARKDLTYRPVTDAPATQIALAWRAERSTPLVEEFIGIVRGRTAQSSRATPTPPKAKKPVTKKGPAKPIDAARARAAKARRRRSR